MRADVALVPAELGDTGKRTVVVIDVLRATTSMAAALWHGVREIRVFQSVCAARRAASMFHGRRLLCGEVRCLKPAGFDLGNSPGDFNSRHRGATAFMSTTNGTRAIHAASDAATVFVGAIVNAATVAEAVRGCQQDVVLLCAGIEGEVALEDVLGAGAILNELAQGGSLRLASDRAETALELFIRTRRRLSTVLSRSAGGRNVIAAGLQRDINFAARLNSIPVTGIVRHRPLRVVRYQTDS